MAVGKSNFKNQLSEASAGFRKYGKDDPLYAMQKLLVTSDKQLMDALTNAGKSSYSQVRDIYDNIKGQYKQIWNQ